MTPFEYQTVLEERINNLARLTRAMHVIGETVFKELKFMAKHAPQVADALELIEANREVLYDMIEDADIQARDLRIAYYEKPKGEDGG